MLPGTLPIIYAGIVIICYQVPYLSYMPGIIYAQVPIIYAGIVIICYQVPYLSYMQELL